MNGAEEIPVYAAVPIMTLLIMGAAISLVGSLGLLRLRSFYERIHAPTLGTTLGTSCVALASIIYFSTLGSRLAMHELLVIAFVTATTPISLMVLVRAAILHDGAEIETTAATRAGNEDR
jgi:multicomponent K+:H+ antiporter subunit G